MSVRKFSKGELAKVLRIWQREFRLMTPSRSEGVIEFSEWDGEDTGFLSWYRNTTVPPKSVLLPPVEKMMSFRKEKGSYIMDLPSNEHKQILFAVRSCDARAIKMIDDVFSDGYEDYYYMSRRRNTLLVGLSCTIPAESCFCTSLSVNPTSSVDVDLMLTAAEDEFLAEALTESGEYLLKIAGITKNASAGDIKKAGLAESSALKKLTRQIDIKNISDKLRGCFNDSSYWEEVAAKCVSCGICTFLCPTCFCFDINDDMFNHQGSRYRGWDSCSFKLYTRMPAENPREEKWRRVRQRVCHKFEFYPMNTGVPACTGCGRCIALCPVNWDITRVIAALPDIKESEEKAAALKA